MQPTIIQFQEISDYLLRVKLKTASQEVEGSLSSSNLKNTNLKDSPNLKDRYDNWELAFKPKPTQQHGIEPDENEEIELTRKNAKNLGDDFNKWLKSPKFLRVQQGLEEILQTQGYLQLTIETDIALLWQLPWHLWEPFCKNPNFIVSYTLPKIRPIAKANLARTKNKIRILAILGDQSTISVNADLKSLKSSNLLEVTELNSKSNLTRKKLYEYLWDEIGWDMLFFAGHSKTDRLISQDGIIHLSSTESISISELQKAMKWAIALGLQIAIFNSCDGVGLAQGLLRLGIPYAIVMSQPVPDQVAGKFIELFFEEFKQGQSLHTSVHNAREELSKQKESEYPSASWLPIICQNSTTKSITFNSLKADSENNSSWESCSQLLLSLSILERLKKNIFVNYYGKGNELEDIYVPVLLEKLDLLFLQNQQKTRREKKSASDRRSVNIYDDERFFKEVIKFRRTMSRDFRVALIGDPGMGKSMFLQRIGDWITSEIGEVVIFISLASLKSQQTLENFLQNQWLTDAKQQVKLPPQKLSGTTKVWLLLDGVDEMSIDGSPLKQINEYIKNSTWISQSRIILTCRTNIWESYKQDFNEFDIYQLQDLSQGERVESFVLRWFANKQEDGKALLQQIQRSNKFKELIHNPLQLSLVCAVFEQDRELPTIRAELYQKFIDNIYSWRKEINSSRKKELNRKLGKLATRSLTPRKLGREIGNKWLKFVEQNYHRVLPQLQKIIEKVIQFWIWAGLEAQDTPFRIPDAIANSVLGKDLPLALELGLLQQVGISSRYKSQEKIYTFFHSSFHTYFAAQTFESDEWEEWFKHDKFYPLHENGIHKVFDRNWQEVILLWFGRKNILNTSKEDFLTALLEFRDTFNNEQRKYRYGFYHLQAHFLAARALEEFPDCSKHLSEKIVTEVVDLTYGSNAEHYTPPESIYIRADKALEQTDKEVAVNLLVQKIKEQPEIELGVAFNLEKISPSHPETVEIFLDWFLSLCNQKSSDSGRDLDLSYAQEWLAQSSVDNAMVIDTLSPLMKLKSDKSYQSELLDERAQSEIATTLGMIAISRIDIAKKSVEKLLEIHASTRDEHRPYFLGDSLEPIVASNPKIKSCIIEELIKYLNDPKLKQDERKERTIAIAESILRIAPTNPLGAEILVNMALASNEYHKLSTKVAIEKLGKAAKGTLNSKLTGFELVANPAKIKMAIANAINKATANLDPNDIEDDQNLIWDKLLEILEEVALGDDATVDIIDKQLESADKPYKRMYLARCLGKIDLGNTSAIVALLELSNPHNQLYDSMREGMRVDQARCYAVQFLAEIDFNTTRAINILLSLLQEFTERWQYALLESGISDEELKKEDFYPNYRLLGDFIPPFNMVLEQLGKLGSGNSKVIVALTKFLDVPKPVSRQVDTAYHLANINVGNPKAIRTLIDIYDDESYKDVERRIINLARNYADKGDRPQIMIDAVKKLLNKTEDESEKMRYAEALGRIDSGNKDAINALVNILNNTPKMHLSNPRDILVKILQGEEAKSACIKLVIETRKYLEGGEEEDYDRYQEWLEVFFHCAENLPYPEFYKAWNKDNYTFPKPQARKLIWLTISSLLNTTTLIAIYWRQPFLLPLDALYHLIKFIARRIKKWLY